MASMSEHASPLDPMDNTLDHPAASKKKRNLPGTPDPHAEVIALSPRTLMATNRFVCEVCGKGFQRDQNLQLHRRGHNLPWKLKQRDDQEIRKRVYVCPEVSCVHHDPSRALGDLTGIKKHYFRKHGDKKWKCEKCSKRYAVQSDWKAHQKVCGTREYRCDCGTVFSRRDSFITHRAFCDALAEESAKLSACNPVETDRQFSDLDGNGAPVRVSSLEASSSPFSQLASSGLDMEPFVREASRFITGLQEGGGDSIALNYASEMSSHRPNKGPSLSLSFGTGPGPGPPGAWQMMERLPHTDNILPMKKVGVFGEETTPWPGMFASMLDSPRSALESLKGYSSTNSDAETWCLHSIGEQDSKASVSMTGENSFRNSPLSQFAPPSSGNISSFIGNGFFPYRSSSCHQQHAGSGQLPATALLQKAAMMGATSSIPSLFHSFGGDPRSLVMNEGRQEPLLGVGSSFSSPYTSLLSNEKQSMGCSTNSSDRGQRTEGSLYPTCTGQGSVQEFFNSLCSGGAAIFPSKPEDTVPAMSIASGPMQGTNGHHYMMGPSNTFLGGLKHQDSSTLAGLSAGDTYGGSRTTLDFLGVGRGETAGMTLNMAQTLSQREIVSMTTLSAGIKREPVTPRKGTMPAWVEGGSSFWSHGS